MTEEEYNDISAAIDKTMIRVANDNTLPKKAAIGAFGILGGLQLFIKDYYEKHTSYTPKGLDEAGQTFRWRNIDEEKPRRGEGCACITVTVDGHIKYSNFEEGPWYWRDSEGFRGYNNYGDKEYHTCSHWMPWDEFFGVLERQFKR